MTTTVKNAWLITLVGWVFVLFLAAWETAQANTLQPTVAFTQGNDSNCDFVAVANGVHNIGGNGEHAYTYARMLVAQEARDFKEGFYTVLGPNGSDQPFTPDNLGAAPEAFIGVYEAMGYNATFMASVHGTPDVNFVRAIRDRLVSQPGESFVHLWTTALPYDPAARQFQVAETGEIVSFPYPYHEIAAVASASDPHHLVLLDGLVGYPYEQRLEQIAVMMRGFNRAIVVSRNNGTLADHQHDQCQQQGQPYVDTVLGGAYLTAARRWWGKDYHTWGKAIGQPYRIAQNSHETVVVPGEYVHYERVEAEPVTLAPLGALVRDRLAGMDMLPHDVVYPHDPPPLVNGIREWVVAQFGSVEAFEQVFGAPLTGEFGLTIEQMQQLVPMVAHEQSDGYYICVLTERAMVVWSANAGTFLAPLGRLWYEQVCF